MPVGPQPLMGRSGKEVMMKEKDGKMQGASMK
jgi:hypothetical protein